MRRKNARKSARFAYKIGNRHGKFTLLLALKGNPEYVPLSRTGFAPSLPGPFEFDSEPEAQAALAEVKAVLEAPDCYRRLAADRRPKS